MTSIPLFGDLGSLILRTNMLDTPGIDRQREYLLIETMLDVQGRGKRRVKPDILAVSERDR